MSLIPCSWCILILIEVDFYFQAIGISLKEFELRMQANSLTSGFCLLNHPKELGISYLHTHTVRSLGFELREGKQSKMGT